MNGGRFIEIKGKAGRFWLALMMSLMILGTAAAQDFGVIDNTNTLNLRADGSSASTWLGSYSRGTWVEILGSKNNFYYVSASDGKRGYMSKNYITRGDESISRIALVTNQGGGAFLNFRVSPHYDAGVLDIFYNGVPLYVLGEHSGWYHVSINGQAGYVRSEFVSLRNWPALRFWTSLGFNTVTKVNAPGAYRPEARALIELSAPIHIIKRKE